MVSLTQKKETMMDFVWKRCSLKLFKVCPILTHRTVRSQRKRECPRGPNRTTATLFAIKWGHDATVLGLVCMAFLSNWEISKGIERSPETCQMAPYWLEDRQQSRFKLNDWLVGHATQTSYIVFDSNKSGTGDEEWMTNALQWVRPESWAEPA